MLPEVVIIGERLDGLLVAMNTVRDLGCLPVAIQTHDVARRALDGRFPRARALVLFLTERDNLADLRSFLSAVPSAVLLVAPTSPPRASLARLATEYGAALCGRDNPPPILEATLVALAAGRPSAEVGP